MKPSLRLTAISAVLMGAVAVSACQSDVPTDEQVEAAAWAYRGRPTSVYLSEHGLGNRQESLAYYGALVGSSASTFTIDQWKSQFIGNAPVHKALYRSRVELGFWREMTCTQLIARGVGGCTVTNWGSPSEPSSGVPNKGTVAMNVSPDGFVRFYVFLPDGKLSPSAVLDDEGPKFLPRLCTVCHSGSNPNPATSADLGSVFREFEPDLLQENPAVSRVTAEQEWFRLNRVVQQANLAIRSEAEGSPFGTDHATSAINDRIEALYIPGGEPDAVPSSWVSGGAEAKTLWSKVMVPYCLACHRHNAYDWTDYANFALFRDPGFLRNYLPNAPDPEARVGAMPQAALAFELLKNDAAAQSAITAWLGDSSTTPAPGSLCARPNEVFQRSCGTCGKQKAVCVTTGGASRVSEYGACANEVVGGCVPGTVEALACGLCGTQTRTCNSSCQFTTSACSGQPVNACAPGAVEFSSAGCTSGQTRRRICQDACAWGSFSPTCSR